MFNNFESIAGKQNIEHKYERIYDMFDLSTILKLEC